MPRKKKITKKTTRKAQKKSPPSSKSQAQRSWYSWLLTILRFWWWRIGLLLLVAFIAFVAYLDISIRQKFEGQKWALPAHVYTRPMELYIGQFIDREQVQAELQELGYQQRNSIDRVGSYRFDAKQLAVHQREFRFWDGLQPQQQIRIELEQDQITDIKVSSLADDMTGVKPQSSDIVRLEPRLFGSVSPLSHEDRSLLKLEDVPPQLINALIAIEDRQFYSHFGINPLGIARAMVRNIRAGRVVQGGSTLTQQLIENYYLESARTVERKLMEMVMAVILEIRYSKDEILQAYLNEVYFSQAGNRAIHGFALGSQTFFGRPLSELDLPELATLAGMINGPSLFNPLRNPKNATKRRNLVLGAMLEEGYIDQIQYDNAVAAKLRVSRSAKEMAPMSYPAFMGFARQGLKDQYRQQDILNDGLQIYTTLNPRIQKTLEQTVSAQLDVIERERNIDANTLQAAAVVIRTDNGEVAAMVGDRKASFSGYNRAVSARRPIGSLIKPFVYLTALEQPERYSLASRLEDRKITVSQRGSPDWQPQNYDGREHGDVMLIDALSRSYNLATVHLGMQIGVENVLNTLKRSGYQGDAQPLPSLLLGAVPMSVMEVGQLYLTLAADGFKTPIKSIRSVLSSENEPLARFPLSIEQVIEPQYNSLVNYALQDVVRNGTARSVLPGFRYDYGLAGKTGTTNDYRDSWFAGFSGNYLTVVWVGRDDNKSTGLTGASGAARIWSKVMQKIPLQRLQVPFHEQVTAQTVYYSQDMERQDCSLSRRLPILLDSLPLQRLPCAQLMQDELYDDERKHFEPSENREKRPPESKKSWWEKLFG